MEAAPLPAGTEKVPPEPPHSLFRCTDPELLQAVERVHDELGGEGAAEAVIVGLASELAEKDRLFEYFIGVKWNNEREIARLNQLLTESRERNARRQDELEKLRILNSAAEYRQNPNKGDRQRNGQPYRFVRNLYDVASNPNITTCAWTADGDAFCIIDKVTFANEMSSVAYLNLIQSTNFTSFCQKMKDYGFKRSDLKFTHENFKRSCEERLPFVRPRKYIRAPSPEPSDESGSL